MADLTLPPSLDDERGRALMALYRRLSDIPVEVVLTTHIDLVPTQVLPHLAWAFSLLDDGWDLASSDQDRRDLLKRAIDIHRHKGTPWAVRAGLAAIGLPGRVVEWFQANPPRPPYTFGVEVVRRSRGGGLPQFALDPSVWARARASVLHTKNARSHLDFLRVTDHAEGGAGLIGVVRSGVFIRLTPALDPPLGVMGGVRAGGAIATRTTIRLLAAEARQ
ncbi:MAG: phage tail protein I [Alphaproteobacteria bacterium]|nr:MAG: phage tail protein I [Alphaproteobacteria bacterium]